MQGAGAGLPAQLHPVQGAFQSKHRGAHAFLEHSAIRLEAQGCPGRQGSSGLSAGFLGEISSADSFQLSVN